jgi:hypothetical protein
LQCGKGYNEMYWHLAWNVKLTYCRAVSLKWIVLDIVSSRIFIVFTRFIIDVLGSHYK